MLLKIWDFNDKSEKIDIFLFSVSQRAYLGMKQPFNACESIHIGDLAQILSLGRNRCLWQDLFPSQSSPFSCQNEDLFHCVMEKERHM